MTFANTADENIKYPDLDRGIDVNAAIAVKTLKRTYNFVMWFFVRDSWMALLPRIVWDNTIRNSPVKTLGRNVNVNYY
ncbi:MAG TPA: hypothetical protein VI934_04535 [Candidatus Nanoarchaeia archaeon]|nr:hypothetical protein [Candidatus Nanoarchaeia archaeon]